jgi:hypothetical protein
MSNMDVLRELRELERPVEGDLAPAERSLGDLSEPLSPAPEDETPSNVLARLRRDERWRSA